jgi:hypothetical protein
MREVTGLILREPECLECAAFEVVAGRGKALGEFVRDGEDDVHGTGPYRLAIGQGNSRVCASREKITLRITAGLLQAGGVVRGERGRGATSSRSQRSTAAR